MLVAMKVDPKAAQHEPKTDPIDVWVRFGSHLGPIWVTFGSSFISLLVFENAT